VRLLPVVDDLRLELERHILERQPSPDEYLLYPEKLGPEFYRGPVRVIWGIEDERTFRDGHAPLVDAALAQMLAGHADIGTTAKHLHAPGHERPRERPGRRSRS
jgi:hypothetical protein